MVEYTRFEIARQQIEFARSYTLALIADIADDDWFRMPTGIHSHVAWQIGHLAVAEYGLGLFRLRGRRDGDAELLTSSFRKQFSKGSTPETGSEQDSSPEEIRGELHGVHEQVLLELTTTPKPIWTAGRRASCPVCHETGGSVLLLAARDDARRSDRSPPATARQSPGAMRCALGGAKLDGTRLPSLTAVTGYAAHQNAARPDRPHGAVRISVFRGSPTSSIDGEMVSGERVTPYIAAQRAEGDARHPTAHYLSAAIDAFDFPYAFLDALENRRSLG